MGASEVESLKVFASSQVRLREADRAELSFERLK